MINIKKIHEKQDILIVGSNWYKILEFFATLLHIAVLILSFLSITEILTVSNENITNNLEIATFSVIIAIIIQSFIIIPITKRRYIKNSLNSFWGANLITTKINIPLRIEADEDLYGKILEHKETIRHELIKINWKNKRLLNSKINVEIRYDKSFVKFIINYIIIDAKSKKIRIDAKLLDLNQKEVILHRDFIFTFYINKKIAHWSGIFPQHPLFGEWVWPKDN
ncbi:MAG: hypothetical protein HPPSJP_2560 [Candidatus Hepatoplasma scabrum]|nr:MAG: hypothetical protein HPPSJP_2560 [Candidatus Hepatoplasma sp.]